MKKHFLLGLFMTLIFTLSACNKKDDEKASSVIKENESFSKVASLGLGTGSPEITAYDKNTKTLFVVNTDKKAVDVVNMANPAKPVLGTPISITSFGSNLNSVAVKNGKLAIAVEGNDKNADKGKVVIFSTSDLSKAEKAIEVGYLPDMVTFTPNGNYVLSANEGEPNDDYTIDPKGSVSIIKLSDGSVSTLEFDKFNADEKALEAKHFRVFGVSGGKPSTLAQDVEPEYIAVSSDSKTAWVSLQENNGLAKVDIESKTITDIYPLGVKDYSLPENKVDVSDKDGVIKPANWPVKSYYQPDAIDFFEVNGTGYIITANEGDARDYDGYSEEKRVKDLKLDASKFPNAADLQKEDKLGRLKITTAYGDTDNDGDYDEIFGYGGRSFSVWTTNGSLVYDSQNKTEQKSIELGTYPDKRSDDKGTEPEGVVTFKSNGKLFAAIGLERSGDVFIYDISNPKAPTFVENLRNTAPEGLLVIAAQDSPTGKTLLVVSNEDKGGVLNIYTK